MQRRMDDGMGLVTLPPTLQPIEAATLDFAAEALAEIRLLGQPVIADHRRIRMIQTKEYYR